MPTYQRLWLKMIAAPSSEENFHRASKDQSICGRQLSLGGADRLKTRSWWRRNTLSASRPACDLNSPSPGAIRILCLPITPSECIDNEGRRAMGLM